jgi:hypothetical protein
MLFLPSLEIVLSFCLDFFILNVLLQYKSKKRYIVFVIGISLTLLLFILFFINKHILDYISLLINLLVCFLNKAILKDVKFTLVLKTHIFVCSVNVIITSIVLFLSNKFYSDEHIALIGFILNMIFTITFIAVCTFKCEHIRKIIVNTTTIVNNIIFISLIVSSILLCLISGLFYYENIKIWGILVRILTVALILIIGTAFPVMIANSISKSFYRKKSEMFEQQIQIQANYYTELAKSTYELRKFKHDFKNISIGINELINKNRLQEALEVINTYNEDLAVSFYVSNFNTGNDIVNALLTDKQNKATLSNTKIIFQGIVPETFITPLDLCIILGNALDNAIEACEKIDAQKQKEITVTFSCSIGLSFITISNPVNNKVEIRNNSIATSKPDKANHGFGIYSIRKAIKKYNGNLELSCDEKIFTLNINLELQTD